MKGSSRNESALKQSIFNKHFISQSSPLKTEYLRKKIKCSLTIIPISRTILLWIRLFQKEITVSNFIEGQVHNSVVLKRQWKNWFLLGNKYSYIGTVNKKFRLILIGNNKIHGCAYSKVGIVSVAPTVFTVLHRVLGAP